MTGKNKKRATYKKHFRIVITLKSILIDISFNFSDPFIKSLIYLKSSVYPELSQLLKKYEKTNFDSTNELFYKTLLADVLDKFSGKELDAMQDYHKILSISTGVNIGLVTSDYKKKSIMRVYEKLFKELEGCHVSDETHKMLTSKNVGCFDVFISYLRVNY